MNDRRCPDCSKPLDRVRHSRDSYLNEEQFMAVRAGDWFCETCPSNGRGNTAYRYFWDHELTTPASPAQPPRSGGRGHE